MDRVGDIVGQEGSVRFLEFRDGVPDPLPGIAVGIDAFVFEDSRVLNWKWAAFTGVEGKWYGVLDSSLAPRKRRLLILSSEDVAKSWRIAGTVERPLFLGAVERLQFVSRDRGCLFVSRDDTDPGTPPVTFQSCTSDSGRTWSPFEQVTSVQ